MPTISYVTKASSTSGLTTYTFSSLSLGTEASDRIIAVTIGGSVSSDSVSTVTINGVSATVLNHSGSNTFRTVAMAYAEVPSGTTGDVVVTWSGAADNCQIGVFKITGADITPYDTDDALDTDTDVAVSINFAPDGVGVFSGLQSTETAAVAWSGATERYDDNLESDDRLTAADYTDTGSGETGRSVGFSWSGNAASRLLGITWQAPSADAKQHHGKRGFNLDPGSPMEFGMD